MPSSFDEVVNFSINAMICVASFGIVYMGFQVFN